MKRLGWGILAFLCLCITGLNPVSAEIGTILSSEVPTKINGPLLITGYSFSGHAIRYVQIFNSSSSVVSLDAWKLAYEYNGIRHVIQDLTGMVAPKQYLTIAEQSVMPTATFTFNDAALPVDPTLSSVMLLPPTALHLNDEVASPSITSSTVRVPGMPPTFYFSRTLSASTGNYTSSFAAFVPDSQFKIVSDGLYEPSASAGVSIVEVYPDAESCPPSGTGLCTDYVKLFNGTSSTIDMSRLRLRTGAYGQSSTASNTTELSGDLLSGHYVSFPITLNASGSWVWLEDSYGVVRYDETIIAYPSNSGHDNEAWSLDPATNTWRWTNSPQPGDVMNQFPTSQAVNQCEGVMVNEIAANVDSEDQFIEIVNATSMPIVLDGCLLQTNRSSSKSYMLSGSLASGELRTIYVKDTPLTLTKTTKGTVYLLSSDALTETNSVAYEDMAEDSSLALVDNNWVQTYAMTPGAPNIWQEYQACDEGYVRNSDTGYCNKIQTVSELTDCGAGKYRNPETNRCRTLMTESSVLAPCAANQQRNPITNRCRSVAVTSALKPCAINQERNPETNRCRNVAGMTTADFPINAVRESSEATLGWWAFGGVGMLALGYAGWEWRSEVLNAIKKAASFIPSRT